MSIEESYLFLLFDSIMSSLILLPNTPMVFKAMNILDGFRYEIVVIVAVFGNAIGASLNYLLGGVLNYAKDNIDKSGESDRFVSLKVFANKRLFLLGLFSFIPLLGVILTLAAGFLRVSYLRFISTVMIGRLVDYYFFY
jgi:membrane protein YqaA with SNARE-associated domain